MSASNKGDDYMSAETYVQAGQKCAPHGKKFCLKCWDSRDGGKTWARAADAQQALNEPFGEDGPDSAGFRGPRPWNGFAADAHAHVSECLTRRLNDCSGGGCANEGLIDDLRQIIADPRAADAQQSDVNGGERLQVWYGAMPESNGKTNYTAMLHRGDMTEGITIDRSEYPDRVRYEADRMRWMIGELPEPPDILQYDADAHSGYGERAEDPVLPGEYTNAEDLIAALDGGERKLGQEAVGYRYRHSESEKWHYGPTPQSWWECRPMYDAAPVNGGGLLTPHGADVEQALDTAERAADAQQVGSSAIPERADFADGKYTVINDNGNLHALRYGESWGRDLTGDNLVYSMLVEVLRLKAALTSPAKVTIDNPDELTPPEFLASHLIDAWIASHGKQIPWEKAIKISAIVTKMADEERDRLLALGDE